jgi:hypothetical protein
MKYNIQIDPPKLSDEAIVKHQDFDALLNKFNQTAGKKSEKSADAPTAARPKFFYWIAPLAAAASVALFLYVNNNNGSNNILPTPEPPLALQAPLPNIQKPFATFTIEANQNDTLLQYSSGSKINIPASAFVDKTGKPVKGKVDIQYREMHDHVDMFVAGVPQVADQHKTAQAAAALQIQGYQNGEPVYINTEKSLQVELHTVLPADLPTEKLAVYAYSADKNDWTFQKADKIEILSQNGTNQNPNPKTNQNPNTSTSANPAEEAKILAELLRKYPEPKAPKKPTTGVDDRETFDIDFKVSDFPELAEFKNLLWAIADDKKSYQNVLTEREWEKMDIKRKGDDKYELFLSDANKKVSLEITPVGANPKDAQLLYEKQLAQYANAKAKHNEQLAQLMQNLRGNPNAVDSVSVADGGNKTIIHRFEVSKFGLWACANLNPELPKNVKANFVDEKGATVQLKQIFAAAPNQRIYYTINLDDNAKNNIHFDKNILLWAIDDKKQIRRLQPVKSGKGSENQTFAFSAPADLRDEQSLRRYLQADSGATYN